MYSSIFIIGTFLLILLLIDWLSITAHFVSNYNVLVLMVEKSRTNRFDLVHIGPAIDIAKEVIIINYFIFID